MNKSTAQQIILFSTVVEGSIVVFRSQWVGGTGKRMEALWAVGVISLALFALASPAPKLAAALSVLIATGMVSRFYLTPHIARPTGGLPTKPQ